MKWNPTLGSAEPGDLTNNTGVRRAYLRSCVRQYILLGMRPLPLFGVELKGGKGLMDGCMCLDPTCKERDWGKHTWINENVWKSGEENFGDADFASNDNVALACGPQRWDLTDWLVVLDADGPGFWWEQLGPLPATMTVKSPRGEHRYFRVPEFTPLGNWVDCFADKDRGQSSLDLRYARGRIVAPPSRNAFGEYKLTHSLPVAPLPQRAIDAILEARDRRGLNNTTRWERGSKRA